jgi:mono/diheme cytochrome c family protein
MTWQKKTLTVGAGVLAAIALGVSGTYAWASWTFSATMDRTFSLHEVDFPVPWPLSEAEIEALRQERLASLPPPEAAEAGDAPPADPLAGVDLQAIATERAIARAEHLLESRYGCTDCHGKQFEGGKMVDDPALGVWYGPNLTARGEPLTVSQWDHIVRHGVRRDGKPTIMPAIDHVRMSDQELSDIIAWARSRPVVEASTPPLSYGPLVKVLTAFGQIVLSADQVEHDVEHPALPPAAEPTLAFGAHLAQACVGCHNPALTGGPIAGGDPSWPPASNLTPHASGTQGWTLDEFRAVFRTGKRRDGADLKPPMPWQALSKMTDTEIEALHLYLQSLTPKALAER